MYPEKKSFPYKKTAPKKEDVYKRQGIDAGSTTTKAALIDRDKKLLYSFYKSNEGNPLETTREMLKELYQLMPENAYIGNTTVTG